MTRAPLDELALQLASVSPAWEAALDADGETPLTTEGRRLSRPVALGVEAIREGWLLHRSASRLAPDASPQLALLLGDWCYAAGLCEVTEHGTLDDVAVLAGLVAGLSANADEVDAAHEQRWAASLDALERAQP